MQLQGIVLGIITILIWGVTFVNTKVLILGGVLTILGVLICR